MNYLVLLLVNLPHPRAINFSLFLYGAFIVLFSQQEGIKPVNTLRLNRSLFVWPGPPWRAM